MKVLKKNMKKDSPKKKEKSSKPIFRRVVLIIVLMLVLNLTLLGFEYGTNKGLTGLTIKESVASAYKNISPLSKAALVGQWLILIAMLVFVSLKDRGSAMIQDEVSQTDFANMSRQRGTDLDTLYNILKEKEQIRISTVSKVFKVDKKTAMEWGKILESGNLAVIDYISTKEPIIKLSRKSSSLTTP